MHRPSPDSKRAAACEPETARLMSMTKATEPRPETILIHVPGSAEIAWRTQRMVSLGADAGLAAEIADSTVDVHDIERLLKAGCPLELAWAITGPLTPAEPVAVEPVTVEA